MEMLLKLLIEIENKLIECKYVEQIFVYGDSLQNYLVGILVPKPGPVIDFLKSKGIDANKDNYKDYFENKDLIKDIEDDIEHFSRSNDIKGFEIVKKVYLSKEAFTVENNLLTVTMKLKRHVAKNYFKEQIQKLYEE